MSAAYTVAGLTDIHARAHRGLADMMAHCATLAPGLAGAPVEGGFGYPTIVRQLYHLMASERYWFAVLTQQLELVEQADEDSDEGDYTDIASLQSWRERREAESRAWIEGQDPGGLNTPRALVTWGGKPVDLVPAHVVMRVCTHFFHHLGQIAAMCRVHGTPIPPGGIGFPLG